MPNVKESKSIPISCSVDEINPQFDCPEEVGHYSIDADGNIHYDRSLMRYYVPREKKNLSLDLNVGYDKKAFGDYSCRKQFEHILQWIKHVKFEPLLRSSVKFVCPRGCIQVLLCAPYMDTFWTLKASKLNGVIYISHVDDTSKARSPGKGNSEEEEKKKRRDFWGYKFEEYMTADVPNGVPDVSSTMHMAKSFNVMLQNRIGPYNLLIKAETDGAKAIPTDGDTSYYVEFKIIKNSKRTSNIDPRKMRKWWARSVVAGIEDIICGFREDNCGIVHSIEVFKTSEIPKRTPRILSPKLCYNFCYHILEYLEKNLPPEDHKVEFKLEYKGDKSQPFIYVSKFVYSDGEEALLPGWYVDELKKHQNYSRP